MSATTHPIAPEEIMAHVDGELSPSRAQSVSAHLDTCADCQELAASLYNTSQSLSNWTVGVPQRLDESSIRAGLEEVRPKVKIGASLQGLHEMLSRKWVWAPALTFLIVLVAFVTTVPNASLMRNSAPRPKAEMLEPVRSLAFIPADSQGEKSAGGGDGGTTHRASQAPFQDESVHVPRSGLSLPQSSPSAKPPSVGPQSGNGYKAWLSSSDVGWVVPSAPMIARSVSLSLIAKDFESARASLDGVLARHYGYAADLNVATPEGAARSLQASLRIPAPQLAAAIAELKALGRVELETQNGEEVTQQHADLVARLKNSRETEQRLQAILTQRTGKISDVLEVEQEIARVRGEIEQMEAEQKNLEHRVDFATIDLKLSEEYKAKLDSAAPSISTQIHNAAVNGYRNVADTLLSIVLFFAEYGPVLIFWLLVLALPATIVWRRWRHATAAI
jgi:Domain of unknown function (DUF4349)/Putative zinc-finger